MSADGSGTVTGYPGGCERQARSTQRQVLSRSRHSAIDREMREEGFDLCLAHMQGVLTVVKPDNLLNPEHISLLGAIRIVPEPQLSAKLIEQLGLCVGHDRLWEGNLTIYQRRNHRSTDIYRRWRGVRRTSSACNTDIGRLITGLKPWMHSLNVRNWALARALSVTRQIGLWCLDGQSPSNSC